MTVLSGVRCIRVGSMNPPKLEGVRLAFASYCQAEAIPVEVESGVSEQPLGYAEIQRGARNRAGAARESGRCDLAVGYEDGLVQIEGAGWMNVGCAVVASAEHESVGLSSGFAYPPSCVPPALKGQPIGGVFDEFWQRHRAPIQRDPTQRDPSALSV
ncbi:MAG: inosine/xanthosine triphosphatase, partial [Myxococcota bacterium]